MPGRTAALTRALAIDLEKAAAKKHWTTKVGRVGWDQPASFEVAIRDEHGQPTGHFATVVVTMTRDPERLAQLRSEMFNGDAT